MIHIEISSENCKNKVVHVSENVPHDVLEKFLDYAFSVVKKEFLKENVCILQKTTQIAKTPI